MADDVKRLFFGLEIAALWPNQWPKGRLIEESQRHVTLAFLGNASLSQTLESFSKLPLPSFEIGPVGIFDKCLSFAHCISWHIEWLSYKEAIAAYHLTHRDFCPHVTVCRQPFNRKEWKEAFCPAPMYCTALHLYESLGHSTYRSQWHHSFIKPFVEIEHTADMAFLIRGATIQELLIHAQIALAFQFPQLLPLCRFDTAVATLDDVVASLNELIARADIEMGSPLKAVSYSGTFQNLEWEMIVDV